MASSGSSPGRGGNSDQENVLSGSQPSDGIAAGCLFSKVSSVVDARLLRPSMSYTLWKLRTNVPAVCCKLASRLP